MCFLLSWRRMFNPSANTYALKPLLLFFLLSTLSVSAQDSIARSEVVPVLIAVHDTLANHHPFAFVANGKERLKATLENVLTQTDSLLAIRPGDSLSFPELIGLAAPLQATIGCGHTYLRRKRTPARGQKLDGTRSAVSVFRVTDGSYVLSRKLATTQDSLPLGTVVEAFEGRPIAPFINSLARFYGVNDHDYLPATAYIIGENLDYFYRSALGHKDTVSITVGTVAGAKTYQIPLRKVEPQKPKSKAELKAAKKPPYRLVINETKKVAHLRIISFNDISWQGFNANKEFSGVIAELQEKGIDKLVLDLRGNLGGSLKRMRNVYRIFAKEKFAAISKMESFSPDAKPDNLWNAFGTYLIGGRRKLPGGYHRPSTYKLVKPLKGQRNYGGDLNVIINERTFSAGTLFAHLVQVTGRGELVGAISGGSSSQTYGGNFTEYTIGKGEELTINVPDHGIVPWRPRPGNLTPDHLVGYTAKDIATGRDTRLEFAFELLTGK